MATISNPRIAIVGGGIAGLTAAWQVRQSAPSAQVTLFEAQSHLGGTLRTEAVTPPDSSASFLVEHSADMFLSQPAAAVQLCEEIGIADQLIKPNPEQRYSYVVGKGNLLKIPTGFALMAPAKIMPVLSSPILSWQGKLRFLAERFVKARTATDDESLRSFAVRHYGEEVFQKLIQPLVAGIYSADANELSIHATLDRFVRMEAEHGSLIKAARAARQKAAAESAGARYSLFFAPKAGMQAVVDAMVAQMPDVTFRTDTCIESIRRNQNWEVTLKDQTEQFDAVILTTRANSSASLLENVNQELESTLNSFQFGSMVVVCIGCRENSFPNGMPTGFGFVVPEIENRDIIACSFSSNKFEQRAPAGHFLMRCFMGGSQASRWVTASDDELIETARRELQDLIGYQPGDHDFYRVMKWQSCMPQYLVGHQAKVQQVRDLTAEQQGLELAGCSYSGVGIPACIQSGREAAERALGSLTLC